MIGWKLAAYGQAGLMVAAICVGAIEKPVLTTRLIANPEKKPQALY